MRITLAALALLLLPLAACKQEAESIGNDKEIVVLADSLQYLAVQEVLSQAYEREVPTPWPEKVFELHWQPMRNLGKLVHKPRLLMLGTLNSDDPASQRVRRILNAQQRERVARGESYMFKTDDPWARRQRLLILAATDIDTLRSRIAANGGELFELFHQPLIEHQKALMYSLYEQKQLEERLRRDYGWSLRIQHDYIVYKEFPEANFVMLRRIGPERWLFIAWKAGTGPHEVTREMMVQWRNELTQVYYENDQVAPVDLSSQEVEFAGRRALQLSGLWENVAKTGGGPFRAWAFFDERTAKIYMIDIAVFAPGMDKIPYLRQLEVMARTFYFKSDRDRKTAGG